MQIFVLGMHRSGTSVVTRILNLMGAYFGPEGISTGANQENRKGFWERKDVLSLNDKLIRSMGSEWHLIADFTIDEIPTTVIEELQLNARKILLGLDSHRPWVVKEPRFCLTFPLWKKLLDFPVCVHVYRSPIQVAQSLQTRNNFPLQFGVALWEKYTLDALKASAGLPRILVSYAEIMAQPLETIKRLYDELMAIGVQGLRLPHDKEILAFIDPTLFREKGTSDLEEQFVNQQQLALIRAFEDKQIFEKELPMNLSIGAQEALRAFEEQNKTQWQLQQLATDLQYKDNLAKLLQEQLDEADQQKTQHTEKISKGTEFFLPREGLLLDPYIKANHKQGIHHLGRYHWAKDVIKSYNRKNILDIACGAGYGSFLTAEYLPTSQVTGIDYDERAVNFAKENFLSKNLIFNQGDIVSWINSDGSSIGTYDCIMSFDTIEHLSHREIALINIAENLTQDGILLLSTPCGHHVTRLYPEWEHHKIEYSHIDLDNLLRRFFKIVIHPEHSDFPNIEFWKELNKDQIVYLNKMNPVFCAEPIQFR